jgi:ribose transport system permease protein
MIIGSILYNDRFMSVLNMTNMFRQVSFIGIIAIGMTFVILSGSGGIDLSVGSIFAVTGVLASYVQDMPIVFMVMIPLAASLLMGFINGIAVVKMQIPPFIVTLATMMGYRGIAYLLTDGGISRNISNEKFVFLGRGYLFDYLPIPALIFIVIVFIGIYILGYTKFGRRIYAVGGNAEVSKMMGIKNEPIYIAVYTISGLLAGIAGLLLAARMGSGQPVAGMGYELSAISAAVIGGTMLSGGVGRVSGTFFGAMVLLVIGNLMNMQGNISSPLQNVVMGAILLIVVIIQSRVEKNE